MKRRKLSLLLTSIAMVLSFVCFAFTLNATPAKSMAVEDLVEKGYDHATEYLTVQSLSSSELTRIDSLPEFKLTLNVVEEYYDNEEIGAKDCNYAYEILINGANRTYGQNMNEVSRYICNYLDTQGLGKEFRLAFAENTCLLEDFVVESGYKCYVINQKISKMETNYRIFKNEFENNMPYRKFTYGETDTFYLPSKTFDVREEGELYIYNSTLNGVNGFTLGLPYYAYSAGSPGGKLTLDKCSVVFSNYETYVYNANFDTANQATNYYSVHKAREFINNGTALFLNSNIRTDNTTIYHERYTESLKLDTGTPEIHNYEEMAIVGSFVEKNILTNFDTLCLYKCTVEELNSFSYYSDAIVTYCGKNAVLDYNLKINLDKFTPQIAEKHGADFYGAYNSIFYFRPYATNDTYFTEEGGITLNLSMNYLNDDLVCSYEDWSISDLRGKITFTGAHIGETFDGATPSVERISETGRFYYYKTSLYFFTIEGTEFLMGGDDSGDSFINSERVYEKLKAEDFPYSEDIEGFTFVDHNGLTVNIDKECFAQHVHLTPKPKYRYHSVTYKNIYYEEDEGEGDITYDSLSVRDIGRWHKLPTNAEIDAKLNREYMSNNVKKYLKGWSLTEGGEIIENNEVLITPENYNNLTLYGVWEDKYVIKFLNEDESTYMTLRLMPGEIVDVSFYDDGGTAFLNHYKKEHYKEPEFWYELNGVKRYVYWGSTRAEGDIFVRPEYTPVTYTLTLTGENVSEIEGFDTKVYAKYGSTVEMPTVEYKYRKIVGWQYLSGKETLDFDFSTPIDKDYTLTAVWENIIYNITYVYTMPNGKEPNATITPQKTTYSVDDFGTKMAFPEIPSDSIEKRYKFKGWFELGYTEEDSPLDQEIYLTNHHLDKGDLTFVAVYESVELRVLVKLTTEDRAIKFSENAEYFSEYDNYTTTARVRLNAGEKASLPSDVFLKIYDNDGNLTSSILTGWKLSNDTLVTEANYEQLIDHSFAGDVYIYPVFKDYAVKFTSEPETQYADWGEAFAFEVEWEGFTNGKLILFEKVDSEYVFVAAKTVSSNTDSIASNGYKPEVGYRDFVAVLYVDALEDKETYTYEELTSVHKAEINLKATIYKATLPVPVVGESELMFNGNAQSLSIPLADYYAIEENQSHTDVGEYTSTVKLKDGDHYVFSGMYSDTYEIAWKITPCRLELNKNTLTANIVHLDQFVEIDALSMFENPAWSSDGSWKNLIQSTADISILQNGMDVGLGGGVGVVNYDYELKDGKVLVYLYRNNARENFLVKLSGNFTSDEYVLSINRISRVYKVAVPTQTEYPYGTTVDDVLSQVTIQYYKGNGTLAPITESDLNMIETAIVDKYDGWASELLSNETYYISVKLITYGYDLDEYEIEGGDVRVKIVIGARKIQNPNTFFTSDDLKETYAYYGHSIHMDIMNKVEEYCRQNDWCVHHFVERVSGDERGSCGEYYVKIGIVEMAQWEETETQGLFTYENGEYIFRFEVVPYAFGVSAEVNNGQLDFDIEKPYEWDSSWEENQYAAYVQDKITYSLTKNGVYTENVPAFNGSGKTVYFKVERRRVEFYDEYNINTFIDPNYETYYGSIVDQEGSVSQKEEGVIEDTSGNQNPINPNNPNNQENGGQNSAGGCMGSIGTDLTGAVICLFAVAGVIKVKRKHSKN